MDGKQKNKKAFCKQFGFTYRLPLFSFIGSLVYEKGADLLPFFIEEMMNTYSGKVNFIVLGSGDPVIEKELLILPTKYADNVCITTRYDDVLSHIIYASSAFLFMPSWVAPCA